MTFSRHYKVDEADKFNNRQLGRNLTSKCLRLRHSWLCSRGLWWRGSREARLLSPPLTRDVSVTVGVASWDRGGKPSSNRSRLLLTADDLESNACSLGSSGRRPTSSEPPALAGTRHVTSAAFSSEREKVACVSLFHRCGCGSRCVLLQSLTHRLTLWNARGHQTARQNHWRPLVFKLFLAAVS